MKKFILVLFLFILLQTCFASGKVKFAVISDPHVSLPAQDVIDEMKMGLHTVEFFESAVKAVNEIPDLDFVLILGDLTKDGEPWNVDKVMEIISKLNVKTYIVLGNHDQAVIQSDKITPCGVSKYGLLWALQGYGFNGPSPYWSADPVEELHIAGLDTNMVGYWGGRVSEKQLKWLKEDLEKNKDKLTIVVGHHSIVPFRKEEEREDWKSFYLENGQELLDILEKYPSVSFYLSGHRHVSTRAVEKNGIYHIVHPATSTYPMRYTVYNLTKDFLEYEVKDIPLSDETRECAKNNFFKFGGTFWRSPLMPDTFEGNEKYLKYYESPETMKMKMMLRFKREK